MSLPPTTSIRALGRRSWPETLRIGEILRKETIGGALLVGAAALALIWANSPWAAGYFAVRDFRFGIDALGLDLTVGQWASDGLLAIFFFLVGLELKREFVAGDLRQFRRAIVPVAAAFGGVAVPAIIYALFNAASAEAAHGWAIPTATDIAFAVAVLAVIGSNLPSALRMFLLTLAVVDDLIAIVIIAVFYATDVDLGMLLLALVPIVVFAVLAQVFRGFFQRRPAISWLILLPIGIVAWAFMHASGIHATIAGVVLGFTVPVLHKRSQREVIDGPGLAETLEHHLRPVSAGFAVPVFAFFAAGVALGGIDQMRAALTDPVTIGIVAGLVLGKPIGITLTTWLMTRLPGGRLDESYRWIDLIGVGVLGGIGFTVSLLITELSFEADSLHHDHAKVAVLAASVMAALLATVILRPRDRRYRRILAEESVDADHDGIPDVYQRNGDGTP